MPKTIQYYSLFITLFLFSSVPSYTEGALRRSHREGLSMKEETLQKRKKTSSPKVFIIFMGVTVASVWGYNGYEKKSSQSDPISTSVDPDRTESSIDEPKNDQNNRQNQTGKASFLQAAKTGQLEIAKQLKEGDANVDEIDKNGNNALHLACYHSGSVEMVTWLLDKTKEGCNIDIESEGQYQRTPFLLAAEKGQLAIAKELKEKGAEVHAKDKNGYNALHLACLRSGSVAMVTWLLDDCGIETEGFKRRTSFLLAAERGQLAIAKKLKEKGAIVHAKDADGYNALHLACLRSGSVAMVTWLLDKTKEGCNIDIESKEFKQRTSFLLAAEEGQLAIAKELKEKGAEVHAKDTDGYNALHLACLHSGSVDMVNWLLDVCGMEIETKGPYQMTPFLFAAAGGHLAIAEELKTRGANIKAKSRKGNNALQLANLNKDEKKKSAMIKYLQPLDLGDNR